MTKLFISHSWEDNDISRKLAQYLKRDGAEIWIDYARIAGGDSLPEIIGKAIEWCDVMVLVWSRSAKSSYYVKLEWTCALSNQKKVIPCIIDGTKLPTILTGILYRDLRNFDIGYKSLARDLKLVIKAQKSIKSEKTVEKDKRRKEEPILKVPSDKAMVEIPEGVFLYGDDKTEVNIDKPYFIDVYPVTNSQYKKFIHAVGYQNNDYWSEAGKKWIQDSIIKPAYWGFSKWNEPDYPVVGASYYEAEAYAKWAGKRLPTEEE